ncbi:MULTISPECIES: tryptophan synthase subunit alpha [unclassified Microcella]|uniref:tryptophan synthase subunit alpha n=1 Tax=unclassified Microcella TaxID=2630066 RepID=UPI0006F249B5|nr:MULTISPECIES: tryptophan synthase subunit alpha [unclassified Microcella]KQV25016.1 tryptophan synthase subunit alpha [Yonghaparkia sp. Root332]KRF31302.1 tryptophan synthase subunit alpha [Yonghaparkia sp. Soil809]
MTTSPVESVIRTRVDAGSGALIGYLPVGFPDLDTSVDAAVALIENGVDIVELGLPYSDPVMDGLVIQRATQAALQGGFTLKQGFEAVERIRSRVDAPLLVMTYWNPVIQYGVERFAADLESAGGAGLITPDLIPDEAAEWLTASDAHDLDRVFLAAPSSSPARMTQAVESSRGFVYAVSTMGITGARSDVDAAARSVISRLREAGATSACVGLGISTPEQVADVLTYADGAIVGSRLVSALADGGVPAVAAIAAELATGKD